ncbi:MAG: transcriptional regulator, partial [bacterium]|nr:transcriptional regulator [bacterium]
MIFGFGEWELDTEKFELRRAGIAVPVEPQTFSIIKFLIENRDRVVTKSDLHETIWKRRTVSDWAVSAGIKSA